MRETGSGPLSRRFDDALVQAADIHRTQMRKGSGTPYVSHLLAVAGTVLENGGTEDEAIAALLHDAPEDQGGEETLDEIRERFGEVVGDIVEGCSDTFETPKPPWRQRKEKYLSDLETASASVRLVSMADKLHNSRSILADLRRQGDEVWKKFKGGRDGSLWYYRTLVTKYRAHGDHPLVEELDRVVTKIESLAR